MTKITWNGKSHNQLNAWLNRKQSAMYTKSLDPKKRFRRASGFPLACATCAIQGARVASIGLEPPIKAVGNLGGALFSTKCYAKTGLKQLFFETPKKILWLVVVIPFLPLLFVINLIGLSLLTAAAPQKTVKLMGVQGPIPPYKP